ncbi:MAG: ABC transporter ATP-binding protein [Proteobacteria bacterium]|nr:ABC transporter ATP-binding protein [Pseudomonadota bacterium]MDA0868034.1 ABC transporter ATP-binding protein [Pseudomonadota bacterium]MDA1327345.1 ABC transporter ATP-binding protein [Pseudomonadota bacterium]
MLEITGLTAHYGASQALFGVDFRVGEGEVVTLLGRNGMGKTTTIHATMGMVKPSGGRITWRGQDITGRPSYQVANVGLGLVPEGRQIFPNLSARENLVATASNHLGHASPWTLDSVLDFFPELAPRLTSMGNLLSGGEQQMLAIGRALMTNPELLILDEATEGLAPLVRRRIWEVLAQLRGTGLSILVVDKNLHDLLKLADRHVVIQRGEVVWSGTSAELEQDSDVRQRYLGL